MFCIALTLIFVGTIVCCFWLKKADASRQIRARKAAEARARAQRMIGAPNPVNEALLTVPQVLTVHALVHSTMSHIIGELG